MAIHGVAQGSPPSSSPSLARPRLHKRGSDDDAVQCDVVPEGAGVGGAHGLEVALRPAAQVALLVGNVVQIVVEALQALGQGLDLVAGS